MATADDVNHLHELKTNAHNDGTISRPVRAMIHKYILDHEAGDDHLTVTMFNINKIMLDTATLASSYSLTYAVTSEVSCATPTISGNAVTQKSTSEYQSCLVTRITYSDGDDVNDLYGFFVALGDITSDGIPDLFIGIPNYTSGDDNNGSVSVKYGYDPENIIYDEFGFDIFGPEPDSRFGASIATGQVYLSDYGQVIIGAPHTENSLTDPGHVYVFNGNTPPIANINLSDGGSADITMTGENAGDLFGISIAVGDTSQNGFQDVVVGASDYDSAKGRVYIFHGANTSGEVQTAAASADVIITGVTADDEFGKIVATGNVNNSGADDVIIAAPGINKVYVFTTVISGAATAADFTISGPSGGTYKPLSMTTSRINDDNYDDLIVGFVDDLNNFIGEVQIFYGSALGISTTADITITGLTLERFGCSVAVGDVDGDGDGDLIVGAPVAATSKGKVYLFLSTTLLANSELTSGDADESYEGDTIGDLFGSSVASGDFFAFSDTSYEEIFAGAPRGSTEDPASVEGAGSVELIVPYDEIPA